MRIISWHNCTVFYFFLIGIIIKNFILDGDYSMLWSILYYLALIWLTCKYSYSYKEPKGPRTDFSVCIIGAGFSGLNMAIKLKQMGVKYQIVEKEKSLGGTWWQNQYPGVGCDVPSYLYSLSNELNPWWSQFYASGDEIYKYLKGIALKHDILDHIKVNTCVEQMIWDPGDCLWDIHLNTGEDLRANAVVCGVGGLNIPHKPDFPGQETFQGQTFHSAEWPENFRLDGHRVALVGTGASAVQILPSLTSKVSHMYVFQRTPAWILPKLDISYPRWLQYLFWIYPPLMVLQRFCMFVYAEFLFKCLWSLSGFLQKPMQAFLRYQVQHTVHDPDLAKKLIPDYDLGCKYISLSNTYFKCFNRENVSLVTSAMSCITENGIKTEDGTLNEVDTIIFATGFSPHRSFHTINVVGSLQTEGGERRPISLQKKWGDTPHAYLGISYPGFPNLFYLLGPGTLLSNSSVLPVSECSAEYTVDAIRFLIERKAKSLDLKPEVNKEYQEWVKKTMQKKVLYSHNCTSLYLNTVWVNYSLWASNLPLYWLKTRQINPKHYNITY